MKDFNLWMVFFSGVLMFIQPCILPLLPVYLNILSNSSNGTQNKRNLVINTILFIIGISTTFFLLGAGMSVLSTTVFKSKDFILFIGGIIIILMGIFYMEVIKIPFLNREFKFRNEVKEMKPWTAYLLGFTFSFGWTPCVGPMLASIFLLASSKNTVMEGNILIFVFSLGFMIPFLLIALFSNYIMNVLNKLKLHMDLVRRFAGMILIITGLLMVLGGAANIRTKIYTTIDEVKIFIEELFDDSKETPTNTTDTEEVRVAPDFTLVDQHANTHTLSDYKGKTVLLSFWATWCPYCKNQMPHLEKLYQEYGYNKEDVVILGIVVPNSGRELGRDGITHFLNTNNYTYPTLFDNGGNITQIYYIEAYPTSYVINKEGNVEGYIPGGLDYDSLKNIIEEYR